MSVGVFCFFMGRDYRISAAPVARFRDLRNYFKFLHDLCQPDEKSRVIRLMVIHTAFLTRRQKWAV